MTDLDRILDHLREARRWAASNPVGAICLVELADAMLRDYKEGLTVSFACTRARIRTNLAVGCKFVRVDPDVLKGYITGALLEIQDFDGKGES